MKEQDPVIEFFTTSGKLLRDGQVLAHQLTIEAAVNESKRLDGTIAFPPTLKAADGKYDMVLADGRRATVAITNREAGKASFAGTLARV